MSALPTTPGADPDPEGRAATLRRAREAYTYDYSYQGLCFTGELPKEEQFDLPYMEQAIAASAALKANRAGAEVAEVGAALVARPSLDTLLAEWRSAGDTGRVGSVEAYEGMFRTIRRPAALDVWRQDWAFAWQRVAGAVPTLLARLDRRDPRLPVTDAHLAAALGPGASIDRALAEGRLYLCDYARFDGIPCGTYPPEGRGARVQKHLAAPLALFCATADRGLVPVAIQCGQGPGPATPIHTPADGARWALAKAVVQVADANLEGIVVHFAYTHMIVQRFILAARRQLSSRHPLLALLTPHFEYTLAANAYARKDLVTPNGTQDRVLAPVLEATLAVLRESLREVTYDDLDPVLAARAAGADEVLAHPFHDDSRAVWAPVRRWVEAYVALYYPSDEAVAADGELRAMIDEIGSPDGGRLPRLVDGARLDSRAGLVDLCARIIHRASPYHAAITYDWYVWMAFFTNLPAAASLPMPPPGAPVDEATLLAMLPPRGLGWEQLAQVYSVDSIHVRFLGEVPDAHFADPRVAPHLARFRAELAEAEATIAERNHARRLPYIALLPSRITASIES